MISRQFPKALTARQFSRDALPCVPSRSARLRSAVPVGVEQELLRLRNGEERVDIRVQRLGSPAARRRVFVIPGLGEQLDLGSLFFRSLHAGNPETQLLGFTLPCLEGLPPAPPFSFDFDHAWGPEVHSMDAQGVQNCFSQRAAFFNTYLELRPEKNLLLLHSLGHYSLARLLDDRLCRRQLAFSGVLGLIPPIGRDRMNLLPDLVAKASDSIHRLHDLSCPILFVMSEEDPYFHCADPGSFFSAFAARHPAPVSLLRLRGSTTHNLLSFHRSLERAADVNDPRAHRRILLPIRYTISEAVRVMAAFLENPAFDPKLAPGLPDHVTEHLILERY